jgi:hypothetical protein
MKIWMTALVLLLMVGLTGVAEAAKKEKAVKGQISAIDGAKITVTTGGKKNPATVDVTTDDKTMVTRDGKDAKVADLKVGDYVSITPDTGTAEKITASTTKPEKKPKA